MDLTGQASQSIPEHCSSALSLSPPQRLGRSLAVRPDSPALSHLMPGFGWPKFCAGRKVLIARDIPGERREWHELLLLAHLMDGLPDCWVVCSPERHIFVKDLRDGQAEPLLVGPNGELPPEARHDTRYRFGLGEPEPEELEGLVRDAERQAEKWNQWGVAFALDPTGSSRQPLDEEAVDRTTPPPQGYNAQPGGATASSPDFSDAAQIIQAAPAMEGVCQWCDAPRLHNSVARGTQTAVVRVCRRSVPYGQRRAGCHGGHMVA